jgi:predicted acylesterase/phospholipase RssA
MALSRDVADSSSAHPPEAARQLRADLPLSVVLGAGSVRGLVHVGILQGLIDGGFRITEMAGTSVGAIILAFYAAVGLDLESIAAAGLSLSSSHLLSWGLLRHSPAGLRRYIRRFAGIIPAYIDRLAATPFQAAHHGVERIGIVAHDTASGEDILCENVNPTLRLEDAVRGAAALPGLFPAWECAAGGRQYRLVDGGVTNRLPVDFLFRPPFAPAQVLAIDISSRPADRHANLERVAALQRRFPRIPIAVLCPDTMGGATVAYRSGYLPRLLSSGRQSARHYLSGLAGPPSSALAQRTECPPSIPT